MGICTLHLLVLLTSTTAAHGLVGSVEPSEAILPVGANLSLTCTLDPAANGGLTAGDVIWNRNSSPLPPDWYGAINDAVSRLVRAGVGFSDTANYHCLFPGDGFFDKRTAVVRVGIEPQPVKLECVIPSPEVYRCHWEETVPTNLRTTHKFEFMLSDWTECPDYGNQTCFIGINYNTGTEQWVRVISTNSLGQAIAETTFHPYTDVVVNTPENVRVSRLEHETSLTVEWARPKEWYGSESRLDFRLRYKKDDCVQTNDTCCCWTQLELETGSLRYVMQYLQPYTAYTVQVGARYGLDEKNWGAWSQDVTETTRETAPSGEVQSLSYIDEVNLDDPVYLRDVQLWWESLPQDSINGHLLGYHIKVKQGELVRQNTTGQVNWYLSPGLERFSGYRIKVAAFNRAGVGPWSVVDVADLTTAPTAPSNVRATADSTTSIRVEWMDPDQPNGYLQSYTVVWRITNSDEDSQATLDASRQSCLLEGLETYALYEIGVKCRNSRGDSGLQYVAGGVRTLEGVPDTAPADLTVKPVPNQHDRLALTWSQLPSQNANGRLAGYLISFCKSSAYIDAVTLKPCSGKMQYQNVTSPDTLAYTLSSMEASTNYTVWLTAFTSQGTGPDSRPAHGKTVDSAGGVILQAVLISVSLLIFSLTVIGCVWRKFSSIRPIPGPKFAEGVVDLSKTGGNKNSRSTTKCEREHFDEIQETKKNDLVQLMAGKCELAREAIQISYSLDLDHKTQTVRFSRSESRDSGVPPSPQSESPDFSSLRDRTSLTEEGDDDVFLDDPATALAARTDFRRAGVMGTTADAVSPYTLVGQVPPPRKSTPSASQSSPLKSPLKRVSFEVPNGDRNAPPVATNGRHQEAGLTGQQRSSLRRSSSTGVSPYTQVSALASLPRPVQQPSRMATPSPCVRPVSTSVPHPSNSPLAASPNTQASSMPPVMRRCQEGGQGGTKPLGHGPGLGSNETRAAKPLNTLNPTKLCSPVSPVSPYSQAPEMSALTQSKTTTGPQSKSVSTTKPVQSSPRAAVSPYTQMSELTAMPPRLGPLGSLLPLPQPYQQTPESSITLTQDAASRPEQGVRNQGPLVSNTRYKDHLQQSVPLSGPAQSLIQQPESHVPSFASAGDVSRPDSQAGPAAPYTVVTELNGTASGQLNNDHLPSNEAPPRSVDPYTTMPGPLDTQPPKPSPAFLSSLPGSSAVPVSSSPFTPPSGSVKVSLSDGYCLQGATVPAGVALPQSEVTSNLQSDRDSKPDPVADVASSSPSLGSPLLAQQVRATRSTPHSPGITEYTHFGAERPISLTTSSQVCQPYVAIPVESLSGNPYTVECLNSAAAVQNHTLTIPIHDELNNQNDNDDNDSPSEQCASEYTQAGNISNPDDFLKSTLRDDSQSSLGPLQFPLVFSQANAGAVRSGGAPESPRQDQRATSRHDQGGTDYSHQITAEDPDSSQRAPIPKQPVSGYVQVGGSGLPQEGLPPLLRDLETRPSPDGHRTPTSQEPGTVYVQDSGNALSQDDPPPFQGAQRPRPRPNRDSIPQRPVSDYVQAGLSLSDPVGTEHTESRSALGQRDGLPSQQTPEMRANSDPDASATQRPVSGYVQVSGNALGQGNVQASPQTSALGPSRQHRSSSSERPVPDSVLNRTPVSASDQDGAGRHESEYPPGSVRTAPSHQIPEANHLPLNRDSRSGERPVSDYVHISGNTSHREGTSADYQAHEIRGSGDRQSPNPQESLAGYVSAGLRGGSNSEGIDQLDHAENHSDPPEETPTSSHQRSETRPDPRGPSSSSPISGYVQVGGNASSQGGALTTGAGPGANPINREPPALASQVPVADYVRASAMSAPAPAPEGSMHPHRATAANPSPNYRAQSQPALSDYVRAGQWT